MLQLKNIFFDVSDENGTTHILSNLSLSLESGKFTVITGPNGSGKSTLAKIIMGIEKPTSGRIIFDGTDITDLSISERAKLGIGYAFQQPPRFKGMTVRNLLSLAHGSELPDDECCAYLTNVGLCSKDYLNREVDSSLSGGEVKRIEIATLMARDLKLAIFDEPEAGIDLWSFAILVDSFKALSQGRHESIIIISHQERIMKIADDIIVMEQGEIKKSGAQSEIFSSIISELSDKNSCNFGRERRNGNE